MGPLLPFIIVHDPAKVNERKPSAPMRRVAAYEPAG